LTELRRPETPDPKRHDRSAFDSGSPELDDWLRRYASQNRRRDTAATWVVTDAESVVVAYVSLSMTGIDRSSAPAAVAKQSPDPVPALLIGRLGVDRSVSGLGVGTVPADPQQQPTTTAHFQHPVKGLTCRIGPENEKRK
jgi:hypothetical protein